MTRELSLLEKQAVDALRRARRLPVGPNRNDLRQLAQRLLWLHRNGMDALNRRRNTDVATAPVDINHLAPEQDADLAD